MRGASARRCSPPIPASATWSSSCSSSGADPNAAAAGFTALHAAIMRRDEPMVTRAARPRRRSERAAQDLDADAPLVEGLQLRARAGRRHAVLAGGALHRARGHAAAAEARRRSARSCTAPTTTPRSRSTPRSQVTTAVMAATGMGGGVAWVQPDRARARSADARGRQAGRGAWRRRQRREHRRPHRARRRARP